MNFVSEQYAYVPSPTDHAGAEIGRLLKNVQRIRRRIVRDMLTGGRRPPTGILRFIVVQLDRLGLKRRRGSLLAGGPARK
eukprot:SAG11_NODE_31756_length_289_cov_1.084211_1_plen_79_part_01